MFQLVSGAGEPGAHRFLRYAQQSGDLLLAVALVVVQQHRQAVPPVQRHRRVEQLPVLGLLEHQRVLIVGDVLRLVPRGAEHVLAAVDRDANEPILHMGVAFERLVLSVQLYQHVLGHIVGVVPAAQIAVCHPEHRVHIPLRQRGELFVRHRGSPFVEVKGLSSIIHLRSKKRFKKAEKM